MLTINLEKDGSSNIQVLTFTGEWDVYEKGRAESYFSQVVSDSPRGLIVDLTPVSLMDSSGVEVLIVYYHKLHKAGIHLALVTNHNNYLIRKFRNLGIFEGTGLEFYETIEEAKSVILEKTA